MTAEGGQFVLANVSIVTDQIWIGGDLAIHNDALANRQAAELVERGVTHVVDCRSELDDHHVWDTIRAVDYQPHGLDDNGQSVPDEWFDEAVEHLQVALLRSGAVVLTHCHAGVNRGPSLGFALLVAEGWDPVDAMSAIRTARPIAYAYYAEQALAWHHRRTGASVSQRRNELAALSSWRRDNPVNFTHEAAFDTGP